jgi:hypothetical protein
MPRAAASVAGALFVAVSATPLAYESQRTGGRQ